MPSRQLRIEEDSEGFWAVDSEGKRVPFGVREADGLLHISVRLYEDEREGCDHCGGMFCIEPQDDDEHCQRCGKSHLECDECDRDDAEVCIECDRRLCSDCWAGHSDGTAEPYGAPEQRCPNGAPEQGGDEG